MTVGDGICNRENRAFLCQMNVASKPPLACDGGNEISPVQLCDGKYDCADKTDEPDTCGKAICTSDESVSIPRDFLCDKSPDCPEGEDETPEMNCITDDPCASNPCENKAECLNMNTTYVCICGITWSGTNCESDVENNCLTDTGADACPGGECVDAVNQFFCSCPTGKYGVDCGKSSTTRSDVHVDADLADESDDCGSENNKCKDLAVAIGKAEDGTSIHLTASSKIYYVDERIWLNKNLILRGSRNDTDAEYPKVEFLKQMVIASPTDSPIQVTFDHMQIMKARSIMVGDASVAFTNCKIEQVLMTQEYIRKKPILTFGLDFKNSVVSDSGFATIPRMTDTQFEDILQTYNPLYSNLVQATLTITNCDFHTSSFHIIAETLPEVMIDNSHFTNENTCGTFGHNKRSDIDSCLALLANKSISDTGLHFGVGVDYATTVGKRKRQTSVGQSNKLTIQKSAFVSLLHARPINEAALSIASTVKIHITISGCEFINNRRAINIELLKPGDRSTSIEIKSTEFRSNLAHGPGGALHLYQQTDQPASLSIENCLFVSNMAVALSHTSTGESASAQISKISGSGGAIALNILDNSARCMATIKASIFQKNSAQNYGGSIFVTPGVEPTLKNNSFLNMDNLEDLRPTIGDVIECRGKVILENNHFTISTAYGERPIFSYRADKDNSYLQSKNVSFNCPQGYEAKEVSTALDDGSSKRKIDTLMIYCRPCRASSYSLSGSSISIMDDIVEITHMTCLGCPYGAVCDREVRAKPNFWGEATNGRIKMHMCPTGYCCQQQSCSPWNTCAENRVGTLCGRCKEGFSESLLSPKCRPSSECTTKSWAWAVIAVYVLVYVLFFFFNPEWSMIARKFSRWLWSYCKGNKKPIIPDYDVELERTPRAYLTIFMYYVQIPALLKMSITYERTRDEEFNDVSDNVANVFHFDYIDLPFFNSCLFRDVTPVQKVFLKALYIFCLFVLLLIFFILGKIFELVCCYRSKKSDSQEENTCCRLTNIPLNSRFILAFIILILYTYEFISEISLRLLNCEFIYSLDQQVLKIDGTVECFQVWQYGVMTFIGVYVIPMFVAVGLAPILLKRHYIGLFGFTLSLIFPLIASPFLIYLYIKHRRSSKKENPEESPEISQETNRSVKVVVHHVAEPYKMNEIWDLDWEGMIILRRLVLVIIATAATNSVITKHLLLVVACLFTLVFHVRLSPFKRHSSNLIETCSLLILLCIAIMNLMKAIYYETGEIPEEEADLVFRIYDIIENVLVSLVPLVVLGFILLALLFRIMALPFDSCFNTRGNDKEIDSFSQSEDTLDTNMSGVQTVSQHKNDKIPYHAPYQISVLQK